MSYLDDLLDSIDESIAAAQADLDDAPDSERLKGRIEGLNDARALVRSKLEVAALDEFDARHR